MLTRKLLKTNKLLVNLASIILSCKRMNLLLCASGLQE
jgi:hypothetical protein